MSKRTDILIGAIAGDIIGSRFEFHPCKSEIFDLFTEKCRFTDDTVLTIAIADAILKNKEYQTSILVYAQRYPGRGYGSSFKRWITSSNPQPYNSYGNGSAMRVSPVGWIKNSIEDTLNEALASAIITHNHSEGLKGAQSIALAIYLARNGEPKGVIREQIMNYFGYNLNQTIADILPDTSLMKHARDQFLNLLSSFCRPIAMKIPFEKPFH